MRKAKESPRFKRSRFLPMRSSSRLPRAASETAGSFAAMRQVTREIYLEGRLADTAYDDRPVPIPNGQTISQPYVVGRALEGAAVPKSDSVLEVGAGSGYLTSLAARLGVGVCAIERNDASETGSAVELERK